MHARYRLAIIATALFCSCSQSVFAQDRGGDISADDASQRDTAQPAPPDRDPPARVDGGGAQTDVPMGPGVGSAGGDGSETVIPNGPDVGFAKDPAPDLGLNPYEIGCEFTTLVGGEYDGGFYVALKNNSGIPIPAGSTYIIKWPGGIVEYLTFPLEIPAGETLYAVAPDGADQPGFICSGKVKGA